MPSKKRLTVLVFLLVIFSFIFIEVQTIKYFHRRPVSLEDYPDAEVITHFNNLYLSHYGVFLKTKWRGINIQQTPTDMWAVQEIMQETMPDFVIETGTLKGGTALYFASILHDLCETGKVITVDIIKQTDGVEKFPLFKDYVIPLIGDSVSDEIIGNIEKLVQGKRALVFLDSNHSTPHVLKEMKLYSRFVPLGGYLIVNDTRLSNSPATDYTQGPLAAVEEFLKSNRDFILDRGREKFLLTFYPKGYLKRVQRNAGIAIH